MLEDSRLPVLLVQPHLAARFGGVLSRERGQPVRVLPLDEAAWSGLGAVDGTNPKNTTRPDNAAYAIYTSGSTGRPKGAVNSHRAIDNRLLWMQEAYALTPADRVLQKTPVSFDVSVWELFWPLLVGARLVLARPGGHQDSRYLVERIASAAVTTLHFVPSMLQLFLEEGDLAGCATLRQVICSGEALPASLARRFADRLGEPLGVALHNLYGPTEAAVDVTSWPCREAVDRPGMPIGRPIANLRIHLLDREGQPVPMGVAGELHIGGVGLARGYLHRPELTAERFVPSPFAALFGEPGARLYRTGDLARHLRGGEVDFLGRVDHQVKVRGLRIEPGEIEAALARQPGVREAAVLVAGDLPDDRRLIAYVVAAGEPANGAARLREALRRELPEYMVPQRFAFLSALPLSPNGKVDRRALAALAAASEEGASDTAGYAAPRTSTEELLAALWAELLARPRVGVRDSFFDVGGHSLLAIRVTSRVRSLFGVELPLRTLFEEPTVAGLAARIEAARKASAADSLPPLVPVPRGDRLPLSFAQERLWFLDRLEVGAGTYNVPAAVRLRGALDLAALHRCLGEIVRRHEALRTTFPEVAGEPYQAVGPAFVPPLPAHDLSALPAAAAEREVRRLARAEAERAFDLARGPLFRAAVVRLGADDQVVLFTLHHIVSDGWSTGVLIAEVAELYGAFLRGASSPRPAGSAGNGGSA
ncbi:MAG TPA: amino acid adenylation domain-containing protein, partial [Thermoanaerobaculia bacterium]